MKKPTNVTDSTLRTWRKRQHLFLAIIVASFVLFGLLTLSASSAQTPAAETPTVTPR